MKRLLLHIACLVADAKAGRLSIVLTDSSRTSLESGTLDPGTGQVELKPMTFWGPAQLRPGCYWNASLGGHMQSSDLFYTNSTYFFVAKEFCVNSTVSGPTASPPTPPAIPQTAVLTAGPQPGGAAGIMASLDSILAGAYGGPDHALDHLHVEWDFACNLIATAPRRSGRSLLHGAPTFTYERIEISDYDGRIRPLPATNGSAPGCQHSVGSGGCWQRRDLLGGLAAGRDYGAWRNGWTPASQKPKEDRCDNCAVFVGEELVGRHGPVQGTRRLVGRAVHNQSVVYNASDTTNLLTMSYLPPAGMSDGSGSVDGLGHYEGGRSGGESSSAGGGVFIGLGVCCELRGCPEGCEGHGGELALVSFNPWSVYKLPPQLIMPIEGSSGEDDALAARMGIAIDYRYPLSTGQEAPRVSAWVNGTVLSWRVSFDEYGTVSLSQIGGGSTPQIDPSRLPVMWGYTNF
jgi:hypothetical protein